eukprot:362910-Chlamydomonas_euryale.AAC.3
MAAVERLGTPNTVSAVAQLPRAPVDAGKPGVPATPHPRSDTGKQPGRREGHFGAAAKGTPQRRRAGRRKQVRRGTARLARAARTRDS